MIHLFLASFTKYERSIELAPFYPAKAICSINDNVNSSASLSVISHRHPNKQGLYNFVEKSLIMFYLINYS